MENVQHVVSASVLILDYLRHHRKETHLLSSSPPHLLFYKPLFKTSENRRIRRRVFAVSPRILEFSLVKPVFLCF